MADNKKYYYLKIKDNFFDSDEMIILESMADGYIYSNILLKLYLRSLKNNGKLMLNEKIPFNSTMLAQVTRHSVGDLEKAVKTFKELGIIEVMDNGAIYMSDIQTFIGSSSSEADRKREYRAKIDNDKKGVTEQSDKCPDKYPPEKELELELELERKKERTSTEIDAEEIAIILKNNILRVNPNAKTNTNAWIKDIEKALRLDGRTRKQLLDCIDWIYSKGTFWIPNIMSGKKLREKYDQLFMQMNSNKQPQSNKRDNFDAMVDKVLGSHSSEDIEECEVIPYEYK